MVTRQLICGLASLCGLAVALGSVARAADQPCAGHSASIAPLAAQSLLLDGAVDDALAIVVGERGHILRSDDGGHEWQQVVPPARATLTAVTSIGADVWIAAGHDGVIVRSHDAGRSWTLARCEPDARQPLLDVLAADGVVHAIGAYGLYLRSMDSGQTWAQHAVNPDEDFHLNAIVRLPNGGLLIAAEAGTAYRSDDAGETWRNLETPYEGSYFSAIATADGDIALLGLRGHLFRSVDDGETWEALDTGTTAMLTAAVALDEDRVLIAGLSGTLLEWSVAGQRIAALPQPDRKGLQRLLRMGDGSLVSVGEAGVRRVNLTSTQPGTGGG
ncbi:MAG: hypothetical protein KDG50_08490 [Chromatiales bacterium]|nr:hypothetical protein [Chromatiales bacterium]